MASVSPTRPGPTKVQSEQALSTLAKYFGPAQQEELLAEDYIAGRNVAGILTAVVAAATFAGLLAVLWIVLMAK